jgi:hypothetical protein
MPATSVGHFEVSSSMITSSVLEGETGGLVLTPTSPAMRTSIVSCLVRPPFFCEHFSLMRRATACFVVNSMSLPQDTICLEPPKCCTVLDLFRCHDNSQLVLNSPMEDGEKNGQRLAGRRRKDHRKH